ncbi:reverse transcriptase domain-containing protein [Tanacetum coccineum]
MLLSRKSRSEPSLLFDLEEDDMAGQAPPQGPIPDLRSMEELLQAPTDGVGDAIVIDTFYNSLSQSDQDSLNSAANGNFLTRNTQEALTIIENKSKVQTSQNKPQVASASGSSTQDAHITSLTKQVEALLSLNRPVNSVQNGCETCGGPHAYYECQAVGGYTQEDVYATTDLEVYNSLADSGASINLMPLSIDEKLRVGPLKPTRMTLELANRSVTFPMGIAGDVIVKVEKFNFLADFVIVDFEADPRVPIILGRPFLRTARALVDLYEEKLTLRFGNEKVVFYTDKSLRNNSSDIRSVHCINIINFSRDKPTSGSTTFPSDSSPSSPLVETSDSLLEEFADELALLDLFPSGNDDDNFDPAVDLREIEYLLNRDPSTVSSPTNDIDIIDPFLERFTVEPALVYSSPPGDDDDDLFYLKSNNDEWKKFLYGDSYNDTHSKNDETKDSKTKSLIDEANIVESNVLRPQLLTSDLTLSEDSSESSEIATLLSSPFRNEDKVFNPGIFILGETHIFNNESKDKDFKVNTSSEVFLILEERNFLSISSHQELLFHPSPCHSFDQPIDQQTDLIAPLFLP